MSTTNKVDFFTVNTGGHVVNSSHKGTDERFPAPTPTPEEKEKMEDKKGFAKASPNVPKFVPKANADKKTEKEAIDKNSIPVKTEEEEDESAS